MSDLGVGEVTDVFMAPDLPGGFSARQRLEFVRPLKDEAIVRAELAGVREYVKGDETVLIPEISRGSYSDHKHLVLPVLSGHEDVLQPMFDAGSREYAKYMSTRKIVERQGPDGAKYVSVTSNIAEALEVRQPGAAASVAKRYTLVQFLTDAEVQVKFQVTESQLAALKTMAVAQPDAAARRATEIAKAARPDLQPAVAAGDYSRSWRWAKASVRENTARYHPLSVTVEATIVGRDLIAYGPDVSEGSRWFVSGPLCVAEEVYEVHKAVSGADTSSVMIALGMELTILGIDIANGERYECPTIAYHVGSGDESLPAESSQYTMSQLTSVGRATVEGMGERIAAATCEGKHVASAVRVSSRYALVNSHVLELGTILLDGKAIMRERELTKDVWLVRSRGPDTVAWPLRGAIAGEQVVVCYRGAGGKVVCTSPMVVFASDASSLSMSVSSELRPGMSGGAIVAVRDMALLGVYEGAGTSQAVGSVFSPSMFAEANSGASAILVSPREDVAADTDEITHRFRGRGLGAYLASAINAVHPLYTEKNVMGMAVGSAGRLYTPCDPEVYPFSSEPDGTPIAFTSKEGFLFTAQVSDVGSPRVTRRASYYEKVVIIGTDDAGPYYSPELRVVHVGLNGRTFTLEGIDGTDLVFQGGLVLAMSDAAVLGVYVRKANNRLLGVCEFCVALPEVTTEVKGFDEGRLTTAVMGMFPTLHPSVWQAGLLEEVFTHSSCQRYEVSKRPFNVGMAPLAYIGDAVLRARLGMNMRRTGVASSAWADKTREVLSNAALSAFADRAGLSELVRVGHGTAKPSPGSKIYADCVEALAGAVYLSEPAENFSAFADLVLVGPELGRFREGSRSISETVLSPEGVT